jgi:DNA-binding response OmpR family regulator
MAYVLIAESQADLRQHLVRLLEQAGHRATAVATVSEATTLLQDEVPDLLATDAVLVDGSSASLVVQAEAAGSKTLMLTGSPDRIVDFDAAGQPYLSKPFPPDLFLQRVRELLGEAWRAVGPPSAASPGAAGRVSVGARAAAKEDLSERLSLCDRGHGGDGFARAARDPRRSCAEPVLVPNKRPVATEPMRPIIASLSRGRGG